jgi:hypothetical protein
LVTPAPRRSAHRKKRPRRPMVGMMLHQDASKYAWLPGDDRSYDLVVTLEDATSAIYSAFLIDEEGTASSFRGIGEKLPGRSRRAAERSVALRCKARSSTSPSFRIVFHRSMSA